jgi:glycosyltransferase involved in cell wall biosynthesis
MRVCLLTSDARHSTAGERIAALAERLDDATVAITGTADWPGAAHVDELSGSFDAVAAFGWQACLHVFRVDAKAHAYVVPALEDALMWHGDERRLLAALTYDLPLTLIAPNRALANALEDRAPGRRIVVVEPGIPRPSAGEGQGVRPSVPTSAPLRVASAAPADEILVRVSEPVEPAAIASADVLLELPPPDAPLVHAASAMLAGVVPVVTPVGGHGTLITDGENGIVVGFDDVPGIARLLDTLARDRELLASLREGALRRAESLPTLDDEAAALREALTDPAPTDAWPARLLLNARAAAEPIAQERRALDEVLREQERRILELNAQNERLTITLERQAQAYRVGKKLEPLWRPFARLRGKGRPQ